MPEGIKEQRFWSKVDRGTDDECWDWKGSTNRYGYGRMRIRGRLYYVHRIVWELFYGPIPEGKLVLHKCDNSLCVNPNHLYIGTQSDNMSDLAIRNLTVSRSRFYFGEVWLMRRLRKGGLALVAIAKMFRCNYMTVSRFTEPSLYTYKLRRHLTKDGCWV